MLFLLVLVWALGAALAVGLCRVAARADALTPPAGTAPARAATASTIAPIPIELEELGTLPFPVVNVQDERPGLLSPLALRGAGAPPRMLPRPPSSLPRKRLPDRPAAGTDDGRRAPAGPKPT